MSELKVNKVTPRSGTTVTLGDSGDTITIPSGVTLSGFATNTPAFSATLSADQTGLGNNTVTKVTFDSEIFDTDSAYDPTTNYRFTVPSGKGGKYLITASLIFRSTANARSTFVYIFKNGSNTLKTGYFLGSDNFQNDQDNGSLATAILDLSAGDFIEIYGQRFSGNPTTVTTQSFFSGFKLL